MSSSAELVESTAPPTPDVKKLKLRRWIRRRLQEVDWQQAETSHATDSFETNYRHNVSRWVKDEHSEGTVNVSAPSSISQPTTSPPLSTSLILSDLATADIVIRLTNPLHIFPLHSQVLTTLPLLLPTATPTTPTYKLGAVNIPVIDLHPPSGDADAFLVCMRELYEWYADGVGVEGKHVRRIGVTVGEAEKRFTGIWSDAVFHEHWRTIILSPTFTLSHISTSNLVLLLNASPSPLDAVTLTRILLIFWSKSRHLNLPSAIVTFHAYAHEIMSDLWNEEMFAKMSRR
ncbi:hypothetical protein BC829DRAFT_477285 [Chytridium lagenaria]|nr:hypothetical protein BC829DRAFT_477285 [Chytridium lagenaria]